jgi:UDP-3-O-[3-hydroxymyristoyl] glucosamine N-acyltransferase
MTQPPPSVSPAALDLARVALAVAGRLHGDGRLPVAGVARAAEVQDPAMLALVFTAEELAALAGTPARVALVAQGLELPPGLLGGWVTCERPRHALSRLLPLFARPPECPAGIHPSAVVAATARVAADACVGPLCWVGEAAVVGPAARLLGQCTLGAGSEVGEACLLYPGVRIGQGVRIGRRVIIHPNACIGADGFSFATAGDDHLERARQEKQVTTGGTWEPARIPSLGTVVVEDDVEIGACTTVDRATLGVTRIRRGSKLDNLVMVGHNSCIGEYCLIAGQSGISGSCEIGDRVIMGGRVGIADHIRVGDDAVLAAGAGVSQHVPPRGVFIDSPAVSYERFRERYQAVGRLRRLFQEVERIRQRLLRLERSTSPDGLGKDST